MDEMCVLGPALWSKCVIGDISVKDSSVGYCTQAMRDKTREEMNCALSNFTSLLANLWRVQFLVRSSPCFMLDVISYH